MFRRHAAALLLAAVLFAIAATATAYFGGTEVFLASTGRGAGASSSQWYTTLWVHNPTGSVANVQFSFLLRDQSNPATPYIYNEAIQPGDTKRYDNAVATMFGIDGFGAIRVVSDQSVLVNSRIYSTPAGGEDKDTVGQFFAAVPATFALANGQTAQLLGVFQTTPTGDSQFRYNYGFVETTGGNVTVRVTAYDTTGASLGSKDYPLGPYEVRQYVFANEFPGISSTNVRLAVSGIGGSGKAIAFGSGLANTSNDPSTFEMSFDDALLAGGLTSVIHDASLAGEGTLLSPLGVADGGVGNAELAANAVTSTKIADGTITGADIATAAEVRVHQLLAGGTTTADLGVLGWSTTTKGVVGIHSNAGVVLGSRNDGVWGYSNDSSGAGVYGSHASNGVAVMGEIPGTVANSKAVYGLVSSTSPGGSSAAVRGENKGTGGSGIGVHGSQDGNGWGVYGTAQSGRGVYGYSQSGNGVYALSGGSARDETALRAVNANSSGGMAGYFGNNSNFATAHFFNDGAGEVLYLQADGGLFIKAVNRAENDAEFTVDYNGNVRADGTFASPAADFAELLPSCGDLEPGDLVAIGPDGALTLTDSPMQTNVAGIYSTKPAFLGGDREDASGDRIPLAIVGIVPVKASAENGAIRPGDLLVASATPGHVMRCGEAPMCGGAVVGKALSGLAAGAGTITTLVSLH